ncbi:uncharacterized protein LOC121754539 [Salvia splendens]|uniref:uncharacterized protein LOC121754539 n=1 Tax=Salvia splendens TaxID=180675 RepID=UPI001C26F96E|nr:uncharacterized protein LOC121754539 [Salvia splendens]
MVEVDRLVREVEARTANMKSAEEGQEERLRVARQLLNELGNVGAVGAINQEAGEAVDESMAVEDSRQRAEKKRKRKETVPPPPKKMRPASRGIVIANIDQPAPPQQGVEGSNTEEREPRWACISRRQQRRPTTPPAAEHAKQTVVLTTDLLRQMLVFENPKWNEGVHHRVTATKLMKAGKRLHQPALETIRVEEKFTQYITGIGFEWLLEIEDTFVPEDLAKEFFTSFRKYKVGGQAEVLERLSDGKLHFISKARKEKRAEQQETRREELEEARHEKRRKPTDRPASPDRQLRQRLELLTVAEPEEAAHATNEWRLRMEQMMMQLVENSQAQLVAQAKVLQAVRQLTLAMQPTPPSTSSPPPRSPTSSRPPSASPNQPHRKP